MLPFLLTELPIKTIEIEITICFFYNYPQSPPLDEYQQKTARINKKRD